MGHPNAEPSIVDDCWVFLNGSFLILRDVSAEVVRPRVRMTTGTMAVPRHSSEEKKNKVINTGSCNDNQTVLVKMSSSYNIFKMSKAIICSKYAIESPKSLHL